MTTFKRVAIGGLGALMPIILNLLVVDFDALKVGVTFLGVLGFVVRVLVLFSIGGSVGYFYPTEKQAFKLFQLGLGAPALLIGMLNGVNGAKAQGSAPPTPKAAKTVAERPFSLFERAAEAEQLPTQARTAPAPTVPAPSQPPKAPAEKPAKSYGAIKVSGIEEFVQGFLGRPNETWFVISASHLTREAAQKHADSINAARKGFQADVYRRFGDNKYYEVVIGAGLTKADALLLQQRAIGAGLPKDTYLWTLPGE
ncbi:MAG TPA: hypothetical protein VOA80_19525 [Thermoanaerobaculia bacterium]|nr:hypothetical protein [Thermoanaerobaculia bacterium]